MTGMYKMVDDYRGGTFTSLLDGTVVPFARTPDGSDRQRATREIEAHNAEIIAQREQAAGKKLSHAELMHGVKHPDTRTAAERIRDSGQTRTNETPPDNSGWVARRVTELKAHPGVTAAERAATRRLLAQYKTVAEQQEAEAAKKEAADALAAKLAEPRCRDAIAHAESIVNDMRFDATVEQREVDAAQQRLALAKTGDHKAYWSAVAPWLKQRDSRILAAADFEKRKAATIADRAAQIVASGKIPADVANEMALAESRAAESLKEAE